MDLGLLDIKKLNESDVLGTPTISIQSTKDGSHWSVPYNVFGKATSVGMSVAKSDHDYNYKT